MKQILTSLLLLSLFITLSYSYVISINPVILNGKVISYNYVILNNKGLNNNGQLNYSSNITVEISKLPINITYNSSNIFNKTLLYSVAPFLKVNKQYNINTGELPIINQTLNFTINPPANIFNFGIVVPSYTNQTRVFNEIGINVTTQVEPIPKLNLNMQLLCGQSYINNNYGINITTTKCINKNYNLTYPANNIINSTYNFSIKVNPQRFNIVKNLSVNQTFYNKTYNITIHGITYKNLLNNTIFNYSFLQESYNARYTKTCNYTITKDNFTYCADGFPELFYGSVIANKNLTEGWSNVLTDFIKNESVLATQEQSNLAYDTNQITQLEANLTLYKTGTQLATSINNSNTQAFNFYAEIAMVIVITAIAFLIYSERRKKNLTINRKM